MSSIKFIQNLVMHYLTKYIELEHCHIKKKFDDGPNDIANLILFLFNSKILMNCIMESSYLLFTLYSTSIHF